MQGPATVWQQLPLSPPLLLSSVFLRSNPTKLPCLHLSFLVPSDRFLITIASSSCSCIFNFHHSLTGLRFFILHTTQISLWWVPSRTWSPQLFLTYRLHAPSDSQSPTPIRVFSHCHPPESPRKLVSLASIAAEVAPLPPPP